MKVGYSVFLGTYLLCLAIRTEYELLKKAGRLDSKSVVSFSIILLVMILMWVSWFGMCPLDPIHLAIPALVRRIGFGIFVAGLVLAIVALIQLRGVENIDHLVTTGLFARLRHPMYLGFILWIFGWAIYHGAPTSFLVGLVGIGNILYWRHLEEEHLEKSFGDKYREYRQRTWL
jgi:protein-S-isoprenylcysteine O-methyltransferase Ste14